MHLHSREGFISLKVIGPQKFWRSAALIGRSKSPTAITLRPRQVRW
jgi:hypothetical protein